MAYRLGLTRVVRYTRTPCFFTQPRPSLCSHIYRYIDNTDRYRYIDIDIIIQRDRPVRNISGLISGRARPISNLAAERFRGVARYFLYLNNFYFALKQHAHYLSSLHYEPFCVFLNLV